MGLGIIDTSRTLQRWYLCRLVHHRRESGWFTAVITAASMIERLNG